MKLHQHTDAEKITIKKLKLRIPVPQKPPKVIDNDKVYKRHKIKKKVKNEISDDILNSKNEN